MSQDTSAYPFAGTFENVTNEVAFIAHSSGTTGKSSRLLELEK